MSVNRIILLGNVGKDPEVRHFPNGGMVANVTLATSMKRKDKASGQYVEETTWHRLQFFEKLAEIVEKYVKKGSQIYVEGRIKYGKYTDKDGVERQTADIIVNDLKLLGGREQSEKPKAKPSGGSGFDDISDGVPW